MKKGIIFIVVLVVIIAVLGVWYASTYNSIIALEENVDSQWAQIDNQLMRRSDLVPDLVAAANKYASYEQETITAISNARAALVGANTVEDKINANNELGTAVSRLLAISESYPELKANQQYIALMDEMAGTENRISVARKNYNDAVKEYNVKIKTFPTVFIANMINAESKSFFEVSEESKIKPDYNL